MSLSMYQVSIPLFVRQLEALSAILDKAEAHATARKIDPPALLTARLFPDMLAFTRQVQVACDMAKLGVARLSGVEAPKHEDKEASFAELKTRIAETLAFIKSVDRAKIDGTEAKPISFKGNTREFNFTGESYLTGFVLPNFFFHATTAYAILRHNGVQLGKGDFLGVA